MQHNNQMSRDENKVYSLLGSLEQLSQRMGSYSNLELPENNLEMINEEKEEKESLADKLNRLMQSEEEINSRLMNFDKKYRYFRDKRNPTQTFKPINKESKYQKDGAFQNKSKLLLKKKESSPLAQIDKNKRTFTEHSEKVNSFIRRSKYPDYSTVKIRRLTNKGNSSMKLNDSQSHTDSEVSAEVDDGEEEEEEEEEKEKSVSDYETQRVQTPKPLFFSKYTTSPNPQPRSFNLRIADLSSIRANRVERISQQSYVVEKRSTILAPSIIEEKKSASIAKYIKDISRSKDIVGSSSRRLTGFHDLSLLERSALWQQARETRLKDIQSTLKSKQADGITFKPCFESRAYADKLGITKRANSRRKSISFISPNIMNSSYISNVSGKSFSRTIKESSSYGELHKAKREFLTNL